MTTNVITREAAQANRGVLFSAIALGTEFAALAPQAKRT